MLGLAIYDACLIMRGIPWKESETPWDAAGGSLLGDFFPGGAMWRCFGGLKIIISQSSDASAVAHAMESCCHKTCVNRERYVED